MFPVRSIVTTPSYRPIGLADEAVATTEQRTKQLARAIKETAIKAAAAGMAIQISLMFVPIYGQLISALITLVQFFTGPHYKRELEKLIEKTVAQIKERGAQAEKAVNDATSLVYDQEYPAAAALALSNQPLGDVWSRIGREAERITDRKIVRVISRVAGAPATLAVKAGRVGTSAVLRGVAKGARAVGMKGFSRDVQKFHKKGDAYAKQIQDITDPRNMALLLTGRQTLLVAEEKTKALKATAFAEIAAGEKKAIDTLQSPEGRAEIRKQTAKGIRGNPDLTLKAQLDLEEAALRNAMHNQDAQLNQALTTMQASGNSAMQTVQKADNTKVAVGAGLAAIAAFLAFK